MPITLIAAGEFRSRFYTVWAGNSRMGFRSQTSHPEIATAAIGHGGGIRAVGHELSVEVIFQFV